MMPFLKKMFLLLIILTMHSKILHAQELLTTYIVDRGETIASIAQRTGITESKLLELNPDAATCIYVGMELKVPMREQKSTSAIMEESEKLISQNYISAYSRANAMLENQQYKEAIKEYTRIIKNYQQLDFACTEAYYGRAQAYYHQGKWKSAIKDLEATIAAPDCDSSVKDHCTEILADAKQKRQEQLERRGEVWTGIIAATAVAAATTYAVTQQSKSSSQSKNSAHSPSNTTQSNLNLKMSDAEFKATSENIMVQTIQDFQAQEWNDYMEFRTWCKKPNGEDYSFDEWQMFKAQAIADNNNTSSSSSTTSTTSQTNNSSTSYQSSQRKCVYCNGTGKLKKYISTPTFGLSETKKKCNDCGEYYYPSSGHAHIRCSHCNGTGIQK